MKPHPRTFGSLAMGLVALALNLSGFQPVRADGVVTNLPATVTLGNLTQMFAGRPLRVSVTTAPPGLPVSVTYNGSTNPPINVGSYTVIATIADTNYAGGATNIFKITRPPPPSVATLPASGVSNSVATLNGRVNPNGYFAHVTFEWGATPAYGNTAPPVGGRKFTGTNFATVTATLDNLTAGVLYHYRIVATNDFDIVRGADQQFSAPVVTLNGGVLVTDECHTAFTDPGASGQAPPRAIADGGYHSLALKADGAVVAWGIQSYGQTNTPPGATNVIAIAAGTYHTLAARADGAVLGWGYNAFGQTTIPARATNAVAVTAGAYHSAAVRGDGSVVAWGDNTYGQSAVPANASNVISVAAGVYHNLALRADGSVVGWGFNFAGQATPPKGNNFIAVAAGWQHSVALRADGYVVAWGLNNSGQTSVPASATNVIAIAAGWQHSLALRADGSVVAWGFNNSGQTAVPASATNVIAIAAGVNDSLALRADGTVVSWGTSKIAAPAGLNQLAVAKATSGSVNPELSGTYTLTYSVTNALGAVGSVTRTVVVICPMNASPPRITGFGLLANGSLYFKFTNQPGAGFTALTSTNLMLPLSNWIVLGGTTEIAPGQFQFTDPQATNSPHRFYRVRSP